MLYWKGFSDINLESSNSNSLLIHAEGLSKSFGSVVFDEISFLLNRGEALGIVGGNGSGKTTLLNIVAGLDRKYAGKLERNCKIGYVMQKAGLFPRLSCLDNMNYICALNSIPKAIANERIKNYANLCDLGDFLRKRAELCSGGMKQRLNVALALLSEPDVLLLDEATAGLDTGSRDALFHILETFMSDGEHSLIMVSHYKQEISKLCTAVLNMETGLIENV